MNTRKPFLPEVTKAKIIWPLLALVAILLFNLLFVPGYFNIRLQDGHLFGSLIDVVNRVSPLLIISLGMTLVIAKEGIDISVGSVLAISAAIAAKLLEDHSVVIAVLAAMGVGVLCGMWNGFLVARLGIQPMVATLILMTVGRGIAQLITDGQILTISNKEYGFIGSGYLLGLPTSVYISFGIFVLLFLLMRRTALGLFLESVGTNRIASEFAGIRSRWVMFLVYTLCGLGAGIAGIIVSANVSSADANNAGLWIELDAILAVVIGGTSMRGGRFYLGGTVIGALFIQSLTTTIYTMGVPPEVTMVVKALVVIFVCLLSSEPVQNLLAGRRKGGLPHGT